MAPSNEILERSDFNPERFTEELAKIVKLPPDRGSVFVVPDPQFDAAMKEALDPLGSQEFLALVFAALRMYPDSNDYIMNCAYRILDRYHGVIVGSDHPHASFKHELAEKLLAIAVSRGNKASNAYYPEFAKHLADFCLLLQEWRDAARHGGGGI